MKPVSCYTEAQRIVICACDCLDAESWALLSKHMDTVEIDGKCKVFTFDDESQLLIEGISYSAHDKGAYH